MIRPTGAIEIDGPKHIAEAAHDLLYSPADILVVRDMLPVPDDETASLNLFDNGLLVDNKTVDELYDRVPELHDLDNVAEEFWADRGYKDFELDKKRLQPGAISTRAFEIHTDYPRDTETKSTLIGPLSLSVCVKGWTKYGAEKPDKRFVDAEGSFDWANWHANNLLPRPEVLRTYVSQRAGDGVIFVNHPQQTLHSVDILGNRPRWAPLFDYKVTRLRRG